MNAAALPCHLHHVALQRRAAPFIAAGALAAEDVIVVDAVADRFGEQDPEVLLGLSFVVRDKGRGHVGIDLLTAEQRVMAELADRDENRQPPLLDWPEPHDWQQSVLSSPLLAKAGEDRRPFVSQTLRDGSILFLTHRMWREQQRTTQACHAHAHAAPVRVLDEGRLERALKGLRTDSDDQHMLAIKTAATQSLTVITGGPGTGKTWSIKRLLALLLEECDDVERPLRIELAAPTGKAAVRMAEAVSENLEALRVSKAIQRRLTALRPRTLHKLIGLRPDGTVRHHQGRPLPADIVVVDEVSMIDLALMRKLLEAVPVGARLILLGDRDQLASVDAGNVLSDMVSPILDAPAAHSSQHPLARCIVPFDKSYRFKHAPDIACIAGALQGRYDQREESVRLQDVVQRMTQHQPSSPMHQGAIRHLGPPDGAGGDSPIRKPTADQLDDLAQPYLEPEGCIGLMSAAVERHGARSQRLEDTSFHLQILKALERYRVLAVHRRGPLGVEGLDAAIAQRAQTYLARASFAEAPHKYATERPWPQTLGAHLGQPLMITDNAYDVGLMNGDVGCILPFEGQLMAMFPRHVGDEVTVHRVPIAQLPRWTSAYAMTVHKSQGSQFERVALVLAGRPSPIQTRELLYTAITRSTFRMDWLGDVDELREALRRRIGRQSGLQELLWSS